MPRTLSSFTSAAVVAIAATMAWSPTALAQDGPILIRQGIRAFEVDLDVPGAITLLRRGVDPSGGPTDSLWSAGVQLLSQLLFDEGDDAQSNLWAMWAMRMQPEMRLDSLNLVSEVLESFETARFQTFAGPGDGVTSTAWTWPAGDLVGATGRLQVRSTTVQQGLEVVVVGRGLVPLVGGMQLPPGTYQMTAAGVGFASASVTREVIPNVTTIVTFDLRLVAVAVGEVDSLLPNNVESASLAGLVQLAVTKFGTDPVCATGVLVGQNGLVLTTYSAIRGSDDIAAGLADGQTISSNIQVAAYDAGDNVAVLKLPITGTDSLPLATDVQDRQLTWALSYPNCAGTGSAELTRVTAWRDRPNGTLDLRDSLAAGYQGGPVIDRSGAIVGLAAGGDVAVPVQLASRTLAQARRNVAIGSLVTAGQMTRQENHIYGTAVISSELSGATIHITPLADWHWPELARRSAVLPITYAGPMGDYAIEVTHQNRVVETTRMTLRPAEEIRVTVGGQAVVAPPAIRPQAGGGGFPVIPVLLGAIAAGAGAFLLLGGGGNGTDPPVTGPGIITIALPNP